MTYHRPSKYSPGDVVGRLTILGEVPRETTSRRFYNARCECGNTTVIRVDQLRKTRSCGCLCVEASRENIRKAHDAITTHGQARTCHRGGRKYTPTYLTWIGMKGRCLYPGNAGYKYYGAKGVTVCQRWLDSFEDFLADVGERPEGKTLDRIDPWGNYEPGNVRWATLKEQAANKRTSTQQASI